MAAQCLLLLPSPGFSSLLSTPLLPFPLCLPPVCFSAEGLELHFTQAFSSSSSSLPGATCSVTPVLKPVRKCVVGCSALTHSAAARPIAEAGGSLLPATPTLQIPSFLKAACCRASQSRRDATGPVVQLPQHLSLHLLLLPSSLLWPGEQLLCASKVPHSTGLWEQGELQQKVG